MSDSDWNKNLGFIGSLILALIIPAILGTIIWRTSASITEDRIKGERNSSYYAEQSGVQIKERCTIADPAILQKCVEEIVRAAHENQRDEADLIAQREMAQWAYAMAVVSGLSLCLAAFGIWYVRANLIEMQEQRIISKSAADAAIRSNTIQSQALMQDRRALHVAQGPELHIANIKFIDFAAEAGLNVEITITNKGKSAALITGVAIRQTVCEALPTEPMYVDTNEFRTMGLHPGDNLILDSDPTKKQVSLTKAQYLAVALGKLLCIMYGRITFNDVFGNTFERGFIIQLESEQVSKDEKGTKFNFRLREPSDVGPFVYLREIPHTAKKQDEQAKA